MTVSLDQQIAEVARELALRSRVYPGLVSVFRRELARALPEFETVWARLQ